MDGQGLCRTHGATFDFKSTEKIDIPRSYALAATTPAFSSPKELPHVIDTDEIVRHAGGFDVLEENSTPKPKSV